jgi:hypothetical protein
MDKEKFEKYVDTALFLVGLAIFGFVAYIAVRFGYAIIESIF